jgi:hypothetical protein
MSKQSIYNMLASKAEPVKVELALVGEMNKIASQAAELQKQAYPMINALNEISFVLDKAIKLISEEKKLYQKGSSLGYEFASKAEDLGMNARDDKNYMNMFDAMNNMTQVMSGLESIAKKYS